MPQQQVKSGILARALGQELVQAHEAHKADSPSYGNRTLPAGIEGGIAQLRECYVGVFKDGPNKGKPFFMAMGVVKRPLEKDGMGVYGLTTQIGPEPLCATPQANGEKSRKTFADHWGWVLNQVRILANIEGEMNLGSTPEEIDSNFVQLLQALTAAKPHFRFRTWKGKKQAISQDSDGKFYLFNCNDKGDPVSKVSGRGPYKTREEGQRINPYAGQEPRVVHEWNGYLDFTDTDDASSATEDDSAVPADDGEVTESPSQETVTTGQEESTPQANGHNTSSTGHTPTSRSEDRRTRDHLDRQGATAQRSATAAASSRGSASAPSTISVDPSKMPNKGGSQLDKMPPKPKPVDDADPQQALAEVMSGGNTFDDMGDIDSLIERAESQDEDAQERLRELAKAAGYDEDTIDNADDWQAVANMATAVHPAGEDELADTTQGVQEPVEQAPEVDEVFLYTPIDKKTNKPGKVQYRCQVVDVDPTARTVTLKNIQDPKKGGYGKVSWDSLVVE